MEKIFEHIDRRLSELFKYHPKDANIRIEELLKVKQKIAEIEKEQKNDKR